MRLLLSSLLLIPFLGFAQQASVKEMTIAKGATIVMSESTEDWNIHLQHLEAPKPGVSGLRAELHRKKLEIMERYPATSSGNSRAAAGAAPIVGANFEGNSFNGVPNDNDMAISNDSIIVSVTNSRIHMYNSVTEEQVLYRSLGNLAQPLGVTGSKFDPKVIYDPSNNRFIIIYLSGYTWETSNIIVAFSQTADPTGEWNLYSLPGNPLENETWSDYPVVGISGKDLYIGINTFTNGSSNNSGFTESCLWQVGLKEGYIGFDLITKYYNDILPGSHEIFNITPIQDGAAPSGENMFLLSNRNTSSENDTLFLIEVTGRVTNPSTELIVRTIRADVPYVLPVPAKQEGNNWFDTNDSRVLGGYTLNNRLHFVQSCTDPSTGTSAIYYGVIDGHEGGNPTVTSRIYSDPAINYGYPNISWCGLHENDEQSIINFNHSSETDFSGFSAIHVNGNLEASARAEIKAGLGFVNVMQDSLERWGDYSGSQRLYDEVGTVWAVGSFGSATHGHGTWIGKLTSPDLTTGITDIQSNNVHSVVFPNPFVNQLEVTFELQESTLLRLELVDIEGKLVRLLMEDRIKAGKNRLSFNGSFLTSGTYFLNAYSYSANQCVFSKRVIKQ
ncbi:MAG: T9SS type A sorting domain-containing protein [Flavobacteriales bacterium]|nr:T9SS type A sorting domain-containing protein [Flavobacteriales bacterium]